MSGTLEGIVRPFQTGDIGPPKTPQVGGVGSSTAATSSPPANTVINPGANGTVKTFSGSFSLTISFYYIRKPKEKQQQNGGGNPNQA